MYTGTDDAVLAWSPADRVVLVRRRSAPGIDACRDQVFSQVVATGARRRLTHDDLRWDAVRWTRAAGITFVTPPGA